MKKILFTILILTSSSLFAQQEAMYSQYMFNQLAINPGYAGSHDNIAVDMLYRYQWVSIDGAPKTISASIHAPFNLLHSAYGFELTNDQIGPVSYTTGMFTYAYRINFKKSKLSFGLQGGFKNNDIVRSKLDPFQPDPFKDNPLRKKTIFDANFGVYYYVPAKFYAGFSSHQLLQNQWLVTTDSVWGSQFSKLFRHFYLMTGGAVEIGDNLVFKPSVMVKYVKNAPIQFDFNASFLFSGTLWLGAAYRTHSAVTLITEVNITQNMRIGYSYDMWLNELQLSRNGSHEFRLSFEINNNKRMKTPRYF
ncbi:MAG: type IX secretion system membrane protein PorP/SprF [Bacteroidales bacterium]